MRSTQAHVPYLGPALLGRIIFSPCVQVISTQSRHMIRIWESLGGWSKLLLDCHSFSIPRQYWRSSASIWRAIDERKNFKMLLHSAMGDELKELPCWFILKYLNFFWRFLMCITKKCSHFKFIPCLYLHFRPILSSHKNFKLSFMTLLSVWCKAQLKFIL